MGGGVSVLRLWGTGSRVEDIGWVEGIHRAEALEYRS